MSLAIAVTSSLAARPAFAEQVPAAPPPAADPGVVGGEATQSESEGTRLKFRTQLDAFYTSNLFHIQDRRIATFDSQRDPDERFYGMNAIWDVVLRPGARASLFVPVGRKREVELWLGADYHLHQQNGIGDYLKLSATGAFDITRHDTAAVEAKYVPRRFEKNHHIFVPDPNNTGQYLSPFKHAHSSELALAARYDRKWSTAVATRLEYVLDQTAYEDPFHNRDELLNEGRAALTLDVGPRSRVELGGGFGVSTSPGEREQTSAYPSEPGIVVDRSFLQVTIAAGAHLAASPKVELDADLEVRNRDYTTNVAADAIYFQRADRRIKLELDVTRKVGSGLSLKAFGGWTRNYSNRPYSSHTGEELGYQELVLGAAATWRFDTGRRR